MFKRIAALFGLSLLFVAGSIAVAERVSLRRRPLPSPACRRHCRLRRKPKKESIPAKLLFAAKQLPTLGKAMAIGYYPRGCLQGGVALPTTGPTWQVMRLSRNRNWGHPSLIKFLEKFAPLAAKATGWKGILVGDLAQPRGGPLPFGHIATRSASTSISGSCRCPTTC